jgi:hypothetical protein
VATEEGCDAFRQPEVPGMRAAVAQQGVVGQDPAGRGACDRQGGGAGLSTANVIDYGWTRSTYQSRSVLITCPHCGHTVTLRDKKSHGLW